MLNPRRVGGEKQKRTPALGIEPGPPGRVPGVLPLRYETCVEVYGCIGGRGPARRGSRGGEWGVMLY